MEGMKLITKQTIDNWSAQIRDSKDSEISLNFTEEMPLLYTKIIMLALFGEDVSNQTIQFINLESGELEPIALHIGLGLILEQIMGMFFTPLRLLDPFFARMRITTYDKRVQKNSFALRAFVRKYISGRKEGRN